LRYQGQGYELTVPWPSGGAAALVTAFHAAHEQRFGYANAGRAVESLVVRLRARVPREAPPEVPLRKARADATPYPAARRTLQLDKAVEAPVYARDRLLAGNVVQGPAVVAQMDSTTLVLPGWRATVDAWGNLLLEEA
jgi:N-methylhydantoinase A